MPGYLIRDRLAGLAGVAAPLALAAVLVPFRASFPNTNAALAMLVVVVAVAANGDRLAGALAAVSTAVWFDFFLTRPYERFTITRRTDIETTVLLLVIGVAVTEIAVWGRRHYAIASRRAGYLDGINNAARAVAAGGSAPALIDQVPHLVKDAVASYDGTRFVYCLLKLLGESAMLFEVCFFVQVGPGRDLNAALDQVNRHILRTFRGSGIEAQEKVLRDAIGADPNDENRVATLAEYYRARGFEYSNEKKTNEAVRAFSYALSNIDLQLQLLNSDRHRQCVAGAR